MTTPRPDLASITYDNPLQFGFKISKEVKRSGWNGGNVVWRIEDPRGFELEISSSNMAAIMTATTLLRGEISVPCRWAWNKSGGSRLVLLTENSQPYKDAMDSTKDYNNQVPFKEVSIGDEVQLPNGTDAVYLGHHHFLRAEYCHEEGKKINYNHVRMNWEPSKRKLHFFKRSQKLGGDLYTLSSPKLATIKKKSVMIMDEQAGADHVNELLQKFIRIESHTDWNMPIVFASPNVIKHEDYTIFMSLPSEEEAYKLITSDSQSVQSKHISQHLHLCVKLEGGNYYQVTNVHGKTHELELTKIDLGLLLEDEILEHMMEDNKAVDRQPWDYRQNHFWEPVTRKMYIADVKNHKFFALTFHKDGQFYPIRY